MLPVERRVWRGMLKRCYDPSYHGYFRWGGRGIMVCDRWLSFDSFYLDMGSRPSGFTLERKDNDGDYSPDNCIWAPPKAQARNRSSNRLITFDGKTMCASAWAEHIGVSRSVMDYRLRWWSLERALTAPLALGNSHPKRVTGVIAASFPETGGADREVTQIGGRYERGGSNLPL